MIYGETDKKRVIYETVGCGAAFLDYDNDGWLDILVLSGTRLDGPPAGTTNRLYKNNRDGTFKDVTAEAGLVRTGWACSVTVGDYNNDGYEDIFVTYYGQNVLYRNNGNGTFTDVTAAAGLITREKPAGAPDVLFWTMIAMAISTSLSPTMLTWMPRKTFPRLVRGRAAHSRECLSIAALGD